MASNVKEIPFSQKDVEFVQKLVHDVLVYTLRKYGIPVTTENPDNESEVNVYNRANFVEIAGLSALRISLLLRDKWKHMFTSRLNSGGFRKETIMRFLHQVILCCPLSWNDTRQSVVEASLALCSEILLFFHHKSVVFDSSIIMDSISLYILNLIMSTSKNVSETIERLIGDIKDVADYDKWITEFVGNFAPFYGSCDVSNYFFEYVQSKWKKDIEKDNFLKDLTLEELRDCMGFLPDDMFAVIAYEKDFPEEEDVALASESSLPSDQKLPTVSEDSAVGGESHEMQQALSASDSVGTAEGEGSSQTSSEQSVEKALEQMSLGAEEVSQECHGAIPKRRKSPKEKKSR